MTASAERPETGDQTGPIVAGGHTVYPAEVEAALLAHAAVAEAVVIGLPDSSAGARVHAIVRLAEGASVSAEALIAFVAERLEAGGLPRTVEFTGQPLRDEGGHADRGNLREDRIRGMAGGQFLDRSRYAG